MLARLQVLSSVLWLVATVMDSTFPSSQSSLRRGSDPGVWNKTVMPAYRDEEAGDGACFVEGKETLNWSCPDNT